MPLAWRRGAHKALKLRYMRQAAKQYQGQRGHRAMLLEHAAIYRREGNRERWRDCMDQVRDMVPPPMCWVYTGWGSAPAPEEDDPFGEVDKLWPTGS